jgi:hypothetical protein
MVAIIGEVLGRPLRYQEVPPEAAGQGMTASGLPEPFVQALMARYAREASEPAPRRSGKNPGSSRANRRRVGRRPRRRAGALPSRAIIVRAAAIPSE